MNIHKGKKSILSGKLDTKPHTNTLTDNVAATPVCKG